MACCYSRSNKVSSTDENRLKIVPKSEDSITPIWCETVLQKGSAISKDTTVSGLEIQALGNNALKDDVTNGGGLSGATIVKVIPIYGGVICGNEPPTMICKISGNTKRVLPFIWRLMAFLKDKIQMDEYFSKTEYLFYHDILPLMDGTGYLTPKIYFIGLDDTQGSSSFCEYVIINKLSKIKSVIIMEDLTDWKPSAGYLEAVKDETFAFLRNVAILHAKFWMLQDHKDILDRIGPSKCDKDCRPRHYSKLFKKKYLSNSSKLQKKINKGVLGKGWDTHLWMKIPKDYATPDWLSIEPSVDGSFDVMTDSMVKEMLSIVVSRLPNYDEHKLKYFNQKEPHTLIHGDLHQGNHLCGTGANEGKVIAVDFQLFGKGLICVELVYLMTANPRLIKSYDEYEEFLREYHNALVENGVTDYSFNDLSSDMEMALVESMINMIDLCSGMTPESLIKVFKKGTVGEDQIYWTDKKIDEFLRILESGFCNRTFVHLTNIYVKDKSKFLMINK